MLLLVFLVVPRSLLSPLLLKAVLLMTSMFVGLTYEYYQSQGACAFRTGLICYRSSSTQSKKPRGTY